MKTMIISLFALSGFVSTAQINHCVQDRYSNVALFDSVDIERTTYTYSIEPRWPATILDTLEMEVFKPSSSVDPLNERPFILMIHGGSFIDGTKEALAYNCMEMARRGYVTATIDYRLGWNCAPTTAYCIGCSSEAGKLKVATYRAVQDSRAAIRYIIDNAASIGIDTSAIFIEGESAGSITALHTAFWDQSEANAFCPSCVTDVGSLDDTGFSPITPISIKGVINHCGAVNNVAILNNASIPVVGFHDELDCIVPYLSGTVINCFGCSAFYNVQGSSAIKNTLNTSGICYGLNTVPQNFAHCSYPSNALIGKASCFIKSILCGTCTSYTTTTIWDIPDCTAGTTSVGLPISKLEDVQIFPNPSTGEVRIRTYSTDDFTVQLVSLEGRLMETISGVKNNTVIDFHAFNSGVYALRIIQANGQFITRKIVLEN